GIYKMKHAFPVAWLVIAVIIGALLIGASYRVLRFLANYEESTVTITNCKKEHVRSKTGPEPWQQTPEYFSFELGTDKLSYPINVNENAERLSLRDALRFKKAEPSKDWCQMVGTSIPVLHYDKLKVVVPYGGARVGRIQLLYEVFGV